MPIYYFAYGSNLLPERLLPRCPSAIATHKAKAIGFDIDFSKVSADGSGKATLVRAENTETLGMIYEISDGDLGSLDKHEGLNKGYYRSNSLIVEVLGTGEQIEVISYIADRREKKLLPYDWYLALVVSGATHHGLDSHHIKRLEAVRFLVDPDINRKGRRQALEAFRAHGVADYRDFIATKG